MPLGAGASYCSNCLFLDENGNEYVESKIQALVYKENVQNLCSNALRYAFSSHSPESNRCKLLQVPSLGTDKAFTNPGKRVY